VFEPALWCLGKTNLLAVCSAADGTPSNRTVNEMDPIQPHGAVRVSRLSR
jgi:hypothetical protein